MKKIKKVIFWLFSMILILGLTFESSFEVMASETSSCDVAHKFDQVLDKIQLYQIKFAKTDITNKAVIIRKLQTLKNKYKRLSLKYNRYCALESSQTSNLSQGTGSNYSSGCVANTGWNTTNIVNTWSENWNFSPVSPVSSNKDNSVLSNIRAEILQSVNHQRSLVWVWILSENALLDQIAQNHAIDMCDRFFFDHTNPDGKTVADRATTIWYKWSYIWENIAMGQTSSNQAMVDWMNSPGHKANILKDNYLEIGVWYYECPKDWQAYRVQTFGKNR